MMDRLIRALALCLALLPLASMADRGQLKNTLTIGDWTSAMLHINNEDSIRVWAAAASSAKTFLTLDLDPDGNNYTAMLIMYKEGNEIGTVNAPNEIELKCELRIDVNPVFHVSCFYSDDNEGRFLTFGKGLGPRFINEMKSGSTVRIKMQAGDEAYYDRFSLRGFTSSFNRAMSMTYGSGNSGSSGEGNDSDYFR